MKLSVIVWDGNFRESLHTIEYFAKQRMSKDDYEFIWVDYYNSNDKVRKIIREHPNFKLITLNNPVADKWHLGICMNKGVEEASGDIIVLPDGDIIVEDDFLECILDEHYIKDDIVLYHRRYDEPAESSCVQSLDDISYLKSVVKLTNPTNFAGCYSLRKNLFWRVKGYEEHISFSGPGMNAMEINMRFRNAGYAIKWSNSKNVYHPWHPNTSVSGVDQNMRKTLRLARYNYPWINPYSGVQQSWIYRCRELNVDSDADTLQCDAYLNKLPEINFNRYSEILNILR